MLEDIVIRILQLCTYILIKPKLNMHENNNRNLYLTSKNRGKCY